MFHIVLFEPEIPPNTGNIIRLAANTGCYLHLIEPLGFELDDKRLRRAGLDYSEWASIGSHENFEKFKNTINFNSLYGFTTKAQRVYSEVSFEPGDALLFGPETRGLPQNILESLGRGTISQTMPLAAADRSACEK